ncbi:MAG: MFS transporter [Leptospirales bacterium]|nr:MFS transporter [Leptospirales bacterium]
MRNAAGAGNRLLLLLILFLDLVGFTVIFPLIPRLLTHYLEETRAQGVLWLDALERIMHAVPGAQTDNRAAIVLLGGALSAVYALFQFLAAPYWGRLSDRIGRRPVLLLTSTGLALSHLAWLLAPNFHWFIAARLFGGLMAGNMGVASAAMADISAPEQRTRAMGLVGAAFGMGFILGPALGGLSARLDAASMPLVGTHPFVWPAALALLLSLSSAALNALFFVETRAGKSRGHWVEHPIRALSSRLRRPGLGPILGLNLLFIFAFSAFEFTFTFFFDLAFGLSPFQIGMVFLYIGVVLVLGQGGLVRTLSKRMPALRILRIGLLLLPLPAALLAFTAPDWPLAMLCLLPIALGSSLVQPAVAGLTSLASEEQEQGYNLSLLRSAGSLGRFAGPAIGALLYFYLGVRNAYAVLALLMAIALALSLKLPEFKMPDGEGHGS